jgi:1-acyl-sn-glycerol-3-phosphate acyltransferase
MTILGNVLRVLLSAVWTGIVGTPLIVCIYVSYVCGRVQALFGRRDRFDRALERNAWLTGWVAQWVWSPVLLAISGIHLRVREQTPIDWSRSHVICANHASIFDILAVVRAVPPPFRFVAKRELVKWPFIGWALPPAGQIIVDRSNHTHALRSITAAGARRIRGQVIFFVEGTRTHTGELLPFKKGAFHFASEHCLPVLPTAIAGSYAALAKAPWWQLHPGRQIEISFLAPIPPPDHPRDQVDGPAVEALLRVTRERIAASLAASRA